MPVVGQYRVVNYDYSHGLPITNIHEIAEDSLGYLWLGSPYGLVRFDGLNFKLFVPTQGDSTSIFGSDISDIEIGPSGKVYVSFHSNGFSIYDHTTQSFRSRFYRPGIDDDFPTLAIRNLKLDEQRNKIYLAAPGEGFYEVDLTDFSSRRLFNPPRVYEAVQDPFDKACLYVAGTHLWRYNKNSQEISVIDSSETMDLKVDHEKILWKQAWSGEVRKFNLSSGYKTTYEIPKDYIIRDILALDNKVWVARYDGILLIDKENGLINRLEIESQSPTSISISGVNKLFQDSKGRTWIGTENGLRVIIPEFQKIVNTTIPKAFVFSGIQKKTDPNEYLLWSGTRNSVYDYNLSSGILKEIPIMNPGRFLSPISSISNLDTTWIFFRKGVGYFTADNPMIRAVEHWAFSEILFNPYHIGVHQCMNNQLLVINNRGVIIKYETNRSKADTSVLIALDLDDRLKSSYLQEDSVLWAWSFNQLYRHNLITEETQIFFYHQPQYQIFNGGIEDLLVDHTGHFWISTHRNGLWKCVYNQGTLIPLKGYYREEGLINNRPLHLVTHDDGHLFVAFNGGICMYQKDIDRFLALGKEYGFPSTNFSGGIHFTGDTLFTFSNGTSFMDINDFEISTGPPSVYISSIRSGVETLKLNSLDSRTSFSHRENDLIIDYISIDLSQPQKITYRYRVDRDAEWIESNYKNTRAILNSLSPGHYRFEIQASGADRQWGPSSTFSFIIRPPFWNTWWFRTLFILSLAAVYWIILKYRERQLQIISNMKTQMSELENEALRAQMNPHFIFNSLNSIKSFIINHRREEAADYLTLFSELIRMVLRNSKSKWISLADEIKALELYIQIENIRLENKFEDTWIIPDNIDQNSLMIQPLTLQPFVENAIWHGFIHKEGQGHLEINVHWEQDFLDIAITDDGVGREKSRQIEQKLHRGRSYGIAITRRRLGYQNEESDVEIIDLYDENHKAAGTKVKLRIPYKHRHTIQSAD